MLLLPYDGSPAARRAAELLCSFRVAAPSVVVLNVQTRPASLWPEPAALDVRAVEAALIEAGQEAVTPAVERLNAAGVRAEGAVRLGFPAQAVLEEAAGRGAEAIVMGTRGEGLLHGFALGSVALRVAHGGRVPALLVKPDARLPAAPGRRLKIALAVDGSEPPVRAAQRLVAWRERLGELDVQLVYAQPPLSVFDSVLPRDAEVIERWGRQAGEQAAQGAREVLSGAGIGHSLHLGLGEPAREITSFAEESGCELVVVGTRGRGASHHALVGSIALKTAARSSVPVLLVP